MSTGKTPPSTTCKRGGAPIYPFSTIDAPPPAPRPRGIPMPVEGARLFTAVVPPGVSAGEYARHFETVSFCLSKGLGAPVGSVIVSDRPTVEKLRRLRRMYGGGRGQARVLAAAGRHAPPQKIPRLEGGPQDPPPPPNARQKNRPRPP